MARLTEIQEYVYNKDKLVVEILAGSLNHRHVRPDGSAGFLWMYGTRKEAEDAETLYLAKQAVESQIRENTASARKIPLENKLNRKHGHPDFYKLLEQMADLHSRKNHDYAGTSDPLKNLRACGRLALNPFIGVMVRLQDKWSRLEEFVKSGKLMVKNESVIDTLMDNAVYSLLAIILYQEQLKKESPGS